MKSRRHFVQQVVLGVGGVAMGSAASPRGECHASPQGSTQGKGLLHHVHRQGGIDLHAYRQWLGAANEFKEGDELLGVAASQEKPRKRARQLLAATRLIDIQNTPPFRDELYSVIDQVVDKAAAAEMADWTLEALKGFLLNQPEEAIQAIMPGLHSDVIGCVVKLMSNEELTAVGGKVFNPLPNSRIGAKGYLGARVQPNSPTDNLDDIRWQVFDAFSYAVGDVLLGTNPVSSNPETVAQVELALQDILVTFGINELMPHCVLAHIDVQSEVEREFPGSTALWFQSIAGTDDANATFDLTLEKMQRYAASRRGTYGLYFETGQGADFTNGHGHGFDMVLHEARKYGFARALRQQVARARRAVGKSGDAWVHLNDVAGFIGPEVFRTREQLVRCCLEDIVMGKLHGLCIGLDVCSTLHMDVSLDDLDWCLERILPAQPAYLMALPTKIDPMLGYLTTSFQDHVRAREKFGFKVNDGMWRFFQRLGVIDHNHQPTPHFGNPTWVYQQYCRQRQDPRTDTEIADEARQQLAQVRSRGLFIAEGHGKHSYDLAPRLAREVKRIYADGKESIWTELTATFVKTIPNHLALYSRSASRLDYILHPDSGEKLSDESAQRLRELRSGGEPRGVQILISDGLNAHSIMDDGQLLPFLRQLRTQLDEQGHVVAKENLVLHGGRVRAGYRIGETLFAGTDGRSAIMHVIGERPGTGHHTFSVYITSLPGRIWSRAGTVDHNQTKVVSGIAVTALPPSEGATETVRVLQSLASSTPARRR